MDKKNYIRSLYNLTANLICEIKYINYGFAFDEKLSDYNPDNGEIYCQNLYDFLVTDINFTNKMVLEIGCGRGGGTYHILKTRKPKFITGIDISEEKHTPQSEKSGENKTIQYFQVHRRYNFNHFLIPQSGVPRH